MKRVSNHRKIIEAKKLGEKRVNPAQNAIQNSKSHYRLIFESAEYGILIIHAATGRIEMRIVSAALLATRGRKSWVEAATARRSWTARRDRK
jgi:hypothetical protein